MVIYNLYPFFKLGYSPFATYHRRSHIHNSIEVKESHIRSILKAITWRIIATSTIFLIAFFMTGNFEMAVKIGGIEFFIKFALYYLHERAWQLAPRGSIREIGTK